MPRLKSEHTPEQWQQKLKELKVRRDRWLKKPGNREKMRLAHAQYRNTPKGKEIRRKGWKLWCEKNRDRLIEKEWSEHGLTVEKANEILKHQRYACAVCKRQFNSQRKPKADHCHDEKKTRGFLCFECNIIEGMVKKIGIAPMLLGRRLASYLSDPPAQRVGALQ